MKREFCRHILEKNLNMKFYQNIFTGSRVVPLGRTDGQVDERTDTTKLIVALCNFANSPRRNFLKLFLVDEKFA
jgi:hypothetical protein